MKTLVVTSCTAKKRFEVSGTLVQEDFQSEKVRERELELQQFHLPAKEMYTGTQHLRLMEGVNQLRDHFSQGVVDVVILSAGTGARLTIGYGKGGSVFNFFSR